MTLWNLSSKIPVAVVRSGDGPSLIINRDTINQLYVGNDYNIVSPGNNNRSIIDPLGTMTVTGTEDVYAVAAAGSVLTDVKSNAFAWTASPAQIAQQIAQLSTVLLSTGNITVPVNSTVVLGGGPISVSLPGYDVSFKSVWNAGIADGLNLRVYMQWQDQVSGLVYDNQEWQIAGAQTGTTAINTIGSGPTQGNQVLISVRNTSTTTAATVSLSLLQNSRNYVRDVWQWANISAITVPGYTMAIETAATGILGDTGMLGEQSGVNIGAGAFTQFLCGLYSGKVRWDYYDQSNGLSPEDLQVSFYAPFRLDAAGRILDLADMRDIAGIGELYLPRTPLIVNVSNHNASQAATVSFHVVAGAS